MVGLLLPARQASAANSCPSTYPTNSCTAKCPLDTTPTRVTLNALQGTPTAPRATTTFTGVVGEGVATAAMGEMATAATATADTTGINGHQRQNNNNNNNARHQRFN